MGTLKTTNIESISGSGTVTLGVSGETFNVPSGVTISNSGTATGFGGDNTPYFYGELSANQTLTYATTTQITGLTNDELDSNTAFDGTTFTVPSGQAGKYFIQGVCQANYSTIGNDGEKTMARIYLNGAAIKNGIHQVSSSGNGREITCTANALVNLSVGNTIELYGYAEDASGGNAYLVSNQTSLMGFKLIE